MAKSCALKGLRCGVQPSSDISLFFLQVLALCLQLCGQPLKLHWLHKVRDWWCREMVPGLAALAPWEAVTSLLGLRMAAVTPLSGCVSPLSWAAAVSAPARLLWDGNIPLAQSMQFRAQLQTQMGEEGSQALQGLRRKGRGGFCLSCQGRVQLACRMLCAPLTALCPAPQTLLILTALVVAAAFIGLGIKWAEEWRSARVSLQVSHLDTRDSLRLPRCTQYLACGDELKGGDWSPYHGCMP